MYRMYHSLRRALHHRPDHRHIVSIILISLKKKKWTSISSSIINRLCVCVGSEWLNRCDKLIILSPIRQGTSDYCNPLRFEWWNLIVVLYKAYCWLIETKMGQVGSLVASLKHMIEEWLVNFRRSKAWTSHFLLQIARFHNTICCETEDRKWGHLNVLWNSFKCHK